MTHVIQRNATHQAIIQVALREHNFLTEAQKLDKFNLSDLDILDGTDEELHVCFTLEHASKQIYFLYSLGFDSDEGGYLPYVEVEGGESERPMEFSIKQFAGETYVIKKRDLLESIAQLDNICGESRYLAFQWLKNFSNKSESSQNA